MCLIAQRTTAGAHIPNDYISYNLNVNPDGFGIAWRDPDEGLLFERFGPKSRDAFKDLLKRIDASNMHYTAHWRKATHGPACLELAHPFSYHDASGVPILAFHNGVIGIKTNPQESDTQVFVNSILANLEHGWWENPAMVYLVEEAIGWSRMLLMTPTDDVIINPNVWKKEGGLMYSTAPFYTSMGVTTGAGTRNTTTGASTTSYPVTNYSSPKEVATVATVEKVADKGEDEFIAFLRDASKNHDILNNEDGAWPSWNHRGHVVDPISSIDSTSGDDQFGSCVCASCRTEGEYYVIDGKLYIDIDHLSDDDDDDDGDNTLLPF